jgi:uncharacterized cupredoxin-like copper-binding protein
MIRIFVTTTIVGVAALVFLVWNVGPEYQEPPKVTLLEQFVEEGALPDLTALVENEEVEHGIFEVPPEDEAALEAALEAAGSMPGMDMSAGESQGEGMAMGGGEGMAMDGGEEMAAEGGLMFMEEGEYDREIRLDMSEWKFSDMNIKVKKGERIKFTIRNTGEIPHEFMFMTMPAMSAITYRAIRADWSLLEHEALYEQALVMPDAEFSMVVNVQEAGVWMFMCMLPYHMQMGMMGQMATEGMQMEM